MNDDDLRKISFEEDLDLIARRLWSSGQTVDLKTAKEIIRPKLEAIKNKEKLEAMTEEDPLDDVNFGRAGKRKSICII